MKFTIRAVEGKSRTGSVITDHGEFETPAFMPVGTQGTVKGMRPADLRTTLVQILLSNTYHLYLRPGMGIMESAGGLHRFMGWDGPILTDSGGYQVFSLSELRKLTQEGVQFKSHLDGSVHFFSPEKVIGIQRSIGSDIMMVLDECPPYPCSFEYAERSNILTLQWAERCWMAFSGSKPQYGYDQSIFGIVQGSVFPELRERSIEGLLRLAFHGYAIGGLAVGEPIESMYDMIKFCNERLPADKPRYLMGVGTPENLLEAIDRGVDMFDCVLPTRNGRNAMLFTRNGPMTIINARYRGDLSPVDPECGCPLCSQFTRAYLRHLFTAREILGLQLATMHNIYYYQWLMRESRAAITEGRFAEWKQNQISRMREPALDSD